MTFDNEQLVKELTAKDESKKLVLQHKALLIMQILKRFSSLLTKASFCLIL